MNTKNIDTNGIKSTSWSVGEQLDAEFGSVNLLFKYLDKSYGGTNGFIDEKALDNLYQSVTGNTSEIDFSTKYGGSDKIVNNNTELRAVLEYLEDLDANNVFKVVTTNAEKKEQVVSPVPPVTTTIPPVTTTEEEIQVISPIPNDIVQKYQISSFHTKYVDVGGIAIFADDSVSDEYLQDAARLVNLIFEANPDVKQYLATKKLKYILEDRNFEDISKAPEGKGKSGAFYSGYTIVAPAISTTQGVGLVHETLHAIDFGLRATSPEYTTELTALYNDAKASKRFKYGMAHYLTSRVQPVWGYGRPEDLANLTPQEVDFVKKWYGSGNPNLKTVIDSPE